MTTQTSSRYLRYSRTHCHICDRRIERADDARQTVCGRWRHQQCGLLADDGRQIGCDCATCEAAQ